MPVLEWPDPRQSPQSLYVELGRKWKLNMSSAFLHGLDSVPEFAFEGECMQGLRGSPFNMCPDQGTLSSRQRDLPYLARR